MSAGRYFLNPEFMEYVRMLYDLHVALKEGRDETAEGQALRDRMDEPGSRLSGEEIVATQGISARFLLITWKPRVRLKTIPHYWMGL